MNQNHGNNNKRVTLHSKLTAVSSLPVNPNTRHPLSSLDKVMALHSVHVIFYYKDNLFTHFDLDPLRVCLSEALSLYPPVTGRICRKDDVEGEWEVKCNDAGVRVVKATVGTTVEEWMGSADGVEERLLAAWDDKLHGDDPSLWSPYRIQINEFEGGGIAIGVSCSHLQADPTSATLLMNSWAETHRREAIVHPPVFTNLSELSLTRKFHSKSSKAYYEAKSTTTTTSPLVMYKMATSTFKFSNEIIEESLEEIHRDATPFDLLAALFWARIARLKHPKSESKHSLSICVDFREKLNLSYGYFGNALHFSSLTLPDVEDKQDLGDVAKAVHRHVSSQKEEDFWCAMEWLESKREEGVVPFRMYGPELTCVNMEHMIEFPSSTRNDTHMGYNVVFDKEKSPFHVSYHVGNVEGEGLIMVMPSPEGGVARMVTVTLPEEELEQLREDEAISRLNPVMTLSGMKQA